MANQAENEGFRVLDDFACEAIHDPAVPIAAPPQQARNKGIHVIEELLIDFGCAQGCDNVQGETETEAELQTECAGGSTVELDPKKIDDAVLALLYLGLHDGARAWKGFDWDVMNRLHEEGYITDPRGKAKSVVFTEEGLERAKRLLGTLFCKDGRPRRSN